MTWTQMLALPGLMLIVCFLRVGWALWRRKL